MRVRATSVVESVNAAIKKHFRNQGGKKRMLKLVKGLHDHSWNVYSKIKANIPWRHRLTAIPWRHRLTAHSPRTTTKISLTTSRLSTRLIA